MNLSALLLPALAAIVVFILYMVALQFAHSALRHACTVCEWDPALLASAEGRPPPVS